MLRFSSIGDIVLATPVLRCLKLQTGAEIHFLTKQPYQSLLAANPYVSQVFLFEKKIQEALPQLKSEQYDLVIDLQKNSRSRWLRLALGVRSFSFDKLNVKKWLLVNFKINRLPPIHLVDRYMKAVAPLGVKNDGQGLDFFIASPEAKVPVEIPGTPYIAFAIGAAHQTKRLPLEHIVKVCKIIKKTVVLLGGKQEEAEGEAIAAACGGHVVNACGKLSLQESAIVVRDAEKVITHDTGMMHIAAAFQKRILSVWGNTVPAFGMYPYYGDRANKDTRFEVNHLSCRPCSKIGFERCPKGHFKCMMNQDLAGIGALANKTET